MTLESAQETAERLAKEAEEGLRDLTASPGKPVELLPCPFCGDRLRLTDHTRQNGTKFWRLYCDSDTDCFFMDYEDEAEAVEMGNRRAPQWQPIETAPKGDTDILVLRPDDSIRLAWWNRRRGDWVTTPGTWQTEATHWQPVPVPLPRSSTGTTPDAAGSKPHE